MLKLDPKDTWIYYQLLVTIGTLVMAASSVVSVYYMAKFAKRSISILREIERNTRVLKTDVLMKKAEQMRLRSQGNQVRSSVADEERFKD